MGQTGSCSGGQALLSKALTRLSADWWGGTPSAEGCGGLGPFPPPATPSPAAFAEQRLPPIRFSDQGHTALEVSIFGTCRDLTPAARWTLNLLRD